MILLESNKLYRISKKCPYGYYLFVSIDNIHDGDFNMYTEYPPARNYQRARCYFGCVEVKEPIKLIRIENGKAIYLGKEPFDLFEKLEATENENLSVTNKGTEVYSNYLCSIKVYFYKKCTQRFVGDTVAEAFDQILFSVNNHFFWSGKLRMLSYKVHHSVTFSFHCRPNKELYQIDDNRAEWSNFEKILFSKEDKPVIIFRRSNEQSYLIRLPNNTIPTQFCLLGVKPDWASEFYHHTESDIPDLFSSSYSRMKSILEKYNKAGLEINIDKELSHFNSAPDFTEICAAFLEKEYEYYCFLQNNKNNGKKTYTFHVGATYDKKYYCAVKLAEKAVRVSQDEKRAVYYISFTDSQVDEIALMFYNLVSPFNSEKDYMIDIRNFLEKNSFIYHLQREIDSFIKEQSEQFGYSGFVTGSLLIHLIKQTNTYLRKELDILYNKMIEEHRVKTKWGSEYKLFTLVHQYVPDATYQYHSPWLGAQSFDIYMPKQKIAIEYQGQQHYEPVDVFGGQEAFENTKERDYRKRKLSSDHGVRVLDWNYTIPVTEENVEVFLKNQGIDVSKRIHHSTEELPKNHILLEMAPIQEEIPNKREEKARTTRVSSKVIRQFDKDGRFISEFDSIKEAVAMAGVSEKSIKNAIYGYRKSGGNYIWKSVERGSPVEDVAPVVQAENTGIASAILQIADDGNIIAEYPSKRAAALAVGISARSISDALDGIQRKAGGFSWKYSEN